MSPVLRKVWTWTRRLLLGGLVLLVVAASVGALSQWALTRRDRARFPPPGRTVQVGDTIFHLVESGSQGPTVVLDAPVGASHLAWSLVQPQASAFARCVSFDRAGYGWSSPGEAPRTSGRSVEELRALLAAAKLPPPYILAGNSLGGLNVRLYALRYPDEVVGLLLVDPVHEEQFERLPASQRIGAGFLWTLRVFQLSSRLGLLRALGVPLGEGSSEKLPEALRPAARAAGYRTAWADAVSQEVRGLEASFREVREAKAARGKPPLGHLPLLVLTRGREEEGAPDAAEALARWTELHRELAAESTRGEHRVVPESGHFIQVDQPEAVVAALHELVGETGGAR